jgi:cytochrome P450
MSPSNQNGTAVGVTPSASLDILDPGFIRDPFPTLGELRQVGPVVRRDTHDEYLVTTFKACQKVLGDVRSFHQPTEFFVDLFGGVVFEALDDERHHQLRAVWAPMFERDYLHTHVRPLVNEVVGNTLDQAIGGDEPVEGVGSITSGIPTRIIAALLGVDPEDYAFFSSCSNRMSQSRQAQTRAQRGDAQLGDQVRAATKELNAYIAEQVEDRRARATDDLISVMVHAEAAQGMTQQDLVANCTQLVFAGNETTVKLLGHLTIVLAYHPEYIDRLHAGTIEPSRVIEETIRYVTIAQVGAPRYVAPQGATLLGHELPAGAQVIPLLGAANRDPARWEHADTFDPDREPIRHLGFGFGMHSCLGLNLARLEAEIYLEELVRRCSTWEVSGVDYGANFSVRGPVGFTLNTTRRGSE